MKSKILLMSLMLGMTFWACEDRNLVTLSDSVTPPVLNAATPATMVLTEATKADTAVRFTWEAPDYGYQAPVSYTLKIDKAGNNFADAIDLATTLKTSVGLTVDALNTKLLLLGGTAGTAMNLELKVVASIKGTSIADTMSNVITMTATPYEVIIVYPHLNLPGSYTPYGGGSWTGTGTEYSRIYSLKSDDRYEGYVYMVNGTLSNTVEFKFTKVDWGNGEYSYSSAGKLVAGGGGNVPLTSGGYYKVSADLNALTYSVTKITSWALIGDATSGGWSTDTPMTYNQATNKWTVTTNLAVGGFKFRANGAWDINYGDANKDFKLDTVDNNNITITTAGNYTITLDLVGPVYKYKVQKN